MELNRHLENHDLGAAIVEGACNVEAKDLAVELGELGLGVVLDETVLNQVPVLKSILACRKTWEAIHDQLFLRKVAGFIAGCPRFTAVEKETFVREHLSDPKKARQLGDSLVLILDKLDDLEKPQMVAKAFAALVRGKLPVAAFRRMAAAIDIGFIEDLRTLANDQRNLPGTTELFLPNLLRTGLVELAGGFELKPRFGISVLGGLFIGIMNEDTNIKI